MATQKTNQKPKSEPKQAQSHVPKVSAKIDKLLDGEGKVKAFASVSIADTYVIRGLRVVEGEKGLFVANPQRSYENSKGETKYQDTFFSLNDDGKNAIVEAVTHAYEQELHQAQQQTRTGPEMTM